MLSSLEKLFGQPPNLSKLHVFRCPCYSWLRPYSPHKLLHHSTLCVFLGYFLTQSAYRSLDPSLGRIYESCHFEFVEYVFPISTTSSTSSFKSSILVSSWFLSPHFIVPVLSWNAPTSMTALSRHLMVIH